MKLVLNFTVAIDLERREKRMKVEEEIWLLVVRVFRGFGSFDA